MVDGYGLPITPEEFLTRLEAEQDKILGEATWMPGIIKLVHHLYKVDCYSHGRGGGRGCREAEKLS